MPLYEYECEKCGHRFEVIQRFADDPLTTCPECEGAVRRLLSAPAVQFKGSGWYVTDYGGRKEPGAASSSSKDSGDSGSSGDSEKTTKSASGSKADKSAAEGAAE